MRFLLLAALLSATSAAQAAAPLKVATWNLGWHLDAEVSKQWRAACSAPFALDAKDGRWKPAAAAGADTKPGWDLPWGRNAPVEWDIGALPPCDTFQVMRQVVKVTEAQEQQRKQRIASMIQQQMRPDVIALQEINGAAAARELLGSGYEVCSYEGHKVQRLAFGWRKELGKGRCSVEWNLSLPQRAAIDQVRPGLALTLEREGKTLRFLTVHLKSSCVSPLDGHNPQYPAPASEARGQLDGPNPACESLQQQVEPLKAWVAAQSEGADGLVLLGDFNRNLSHEASESANLPTRGAANGRVRNLWRALNEGRSLKLLESQCGGLEACTLAKNRQLERSEYSQVRANLGCRNPLGLDHIVVGLGMKGDSATKQAMGTQGETRFMPGGGFELGLSDHCPLTAELSY